MTEDEKQIVNFVSEEIHQRMDNMIYEMTTLSCLKCDLWNKAAIEAGYASGMCEDCYAKFFVSVNLSYDQQTPTSLPPQA